MKRALQVSILTLTRNRAELLRKNLASLIGQTRTGDEIIVIDNNSTDHTASVINAFGDILPIRSYVSHLTGFSTLYNLAVKKAKNPLLIFLDDDCIAAPGFVQGHRNAHRNGKPHVVQGWSKSIPKGNIYAEMTGDHYHNWITTYMTKNGKMITFDNKNVSFPKKLLKTYGAFSPKLLKGGEDIELGRRLSRHGVPIVFKPKILAYHHERDTFRAFIRQHLRFAQSDANLARQLHQETTFAAFVGYKIYLHTQSALRRELRYIQTGNIVNAILLPLLYVLLLFLRIWGYATSK